MKLGDWDSKLHYYETVNVVRVSTSCTKDRANHDFRTREIILIATSDVSSSLTSPLVHRLWPAINQPVLPMAVDMHAASDPTAALPKAALSSAF